jgi:hypothetical protein
MYLLSNGGGGSGNVQGAGEISDDDDFDGLHYRTLNFFVGVLS